MTRWLLLLALIWQASSTGLVAVESGAEGPTSQKDPMSELLHWAIEHSDPETLKNLMEEYKEKNLTIKDIYGQEVVDAFFKSEGDVMSQQIAVIQDFRNASVPDSMLEAALEELEELLHQVDHAGNLNRMGGMRPLLELALSTERNEAIRSLALWALGVAVQNNAPVQEELHGLQGLTRLAERLRRGGGGEAFEGKLLFCLSGLLKNAVAYQLEAEQLGVNDWMMEVGLRHQAVAVVKKALGYLDTVLAQNPKLAFLERLQLTQAHLLLGLVASDDLDTAEKALSLFSRLATLRPELFRGLGKDLRDAARCEGSELCGQLLSSAEEVAGRLEL